MKPCLYIAIALAVLGLSCDRSAPVEAVKVEIDGLYSVELPVNLKPGYNMHPYAGLQYYDEAAGFYVMCVDDMKENLGPVRRHRIRIKGYYNFVELTVFERADSISLIAQDNFVLDGLHVKTGDYYVSSEYWGDVYAFFYRIAVYESADYFFQLVMYMPFEDRERQVKSVDRITQSFRLLNSGGENVDGQGL